MCNHDINHLVGTSDGIVCRKCGKTFPTWGALMADKYPATAQEAPEAVTEAQEKPKRGRKKKGDGA